MLPGPKEADALTSILQGLKRWILAREEGAY